MQNYDNIKGEVLESCRWLAKHGYLGQLSSGGNISARVPGEKIVAITPSGRSYFSLELSDICVVGFDRQSIESDLAPSIEAGLHIGVYQNRPDVNAVIHDHPLHSSVLGVAKMELPAISEDFAQIVGDKIICCEYALPGTPELAACAVEALGDRNAVLLPNHGTLCVGENLKHVLRVCHVVEKAAHMYILARLIGTPQVISDENVKAMQYFARNLYGQR